MKNLISNVSIDYKTLPAMDTALYHKSVLDIIKPAGREHSGAKGK